MSREPFFVIIIFVLLSSLLYVGLHSVVEATNSYRVENQDTGLFYATIQEAINANETLDGHRLLLDLIVFWEHIVINKSVALFGAINLGLPSPPFPDMTTINGSGTGTVISVEADNVTMHAIKIINGTTGIIVEESDNTVLWWLRIYDNAEFGIYLHNSRNCTVRSSKITNNNMLGICLEQSSNNSITGNDITNNNNGVYFNQSAYNTLSSNRIADNHEVGIRLDHSFNNSILGNNITDNGDGIWLEGSSNHNSISNNNITKNGIGIEFIYSFDNSISGNIITSNHYGIELCLSSNSRLRNNVLADNDINFVVLGKALSDFINDVDPSNTADSKKIYYLINQRDFLVPSDAGFVVLVNCTNVIVKNLKPKNNIPSILLAYTKNSTITKNNITNSLDSDLAINIWLINSSGNNIYDNNIEKGQNGIYLSNSSYNNIYSNTITEIDYFGGITLSKSSYNNIYANTLTNGNGISLFTSLNNLIIQNNLNLTSDWMCLMINLTGQLVCGGRVVLYGSSNNVIYHNNFVMNRNLLYINDSMNIWDDGYQSGGNYWSDYTGVDSNHDGIGDSSYEIDQDNTDCYPLMGVFSSFNTSIGYDVNVISNSTVEDLYYFESNNTIKMHVTGLEGIGFCRVCFPKLLFCPQCLPYVAAVINDGLTPVLYDNYTLYENATHKWIYFAYEHSTHEIDIIPEFPSFLILPLFMIATLLTVIVYRRKYSI